MSLNPELTDRLAAVWVNNPPKRYTPRAIDGGPEWEVWDGVKNRFVKGRHLIIIPIDELKNEVIA